MFEPWSQSHQAHCIRMVVNIVFCSKRSVPSNKSRQYTYNVILWHARAMCLPRCLSEQKNVLRSLCQVPDIFCPISTKFWISSTDFFYKSPHTKFHGDLFSELRALLLLQLALQPSVGFGLLYDFFPQSSIFTLLSPISHFHLF